MLKRRLELSERLLEVTIVCRDVQKVVAARIKHFPVTLLLVNDLLLWSGLGGAGLLFIVVFRLFLFNVVTTGFLGCSDCITFLWLLLLRCLLYLDSRLL